MKALIYRALLALLLLGLPEAQARVIFVNPREGTDTADGLSELPSNGSGPVKSIKAGIALAQPGDTVKLDPGSSPYLEQVLFSDKSGTAEAPITLDGRGAIIEGSVPIVPSEWETQGNGLYKSTVVPEIYCHRANPAFVGRFFFLMNGEMNRMGRSAKGSVTPYKTPGDLADGEWTYVESEKAFYIKIPPDSTLADSDIRVPKIISGVQITGNCHHLTIRNISVTHVINDGFALTVGHDKTNTVRSIRFENIVARNCGDDGLSAHGDCEVFVDGFLSTGNSTGYCSQGTSINRRVRTENIDGMDIYPIGGRHEFHDSVVMSKALRPVMVTAVPPATTVDLVLENCLIVNASDRPPTHSVIRIDPGGTLSAQRITTMGMAFIVTDGATANLENSLIAGGSEVFIQCFPKALWKGARNIYDIGAFRIGKESFSPQDFAKIQSLTSETGSAFQSLGTISPTQVPKNIPTDVGANPALLPLN